jgi:hypothetical protein
VPRISKDTHEPCYPHIHTHLPPHTEHCSIQGESTHVGRKRTLVAAAFLRAAFTGDGLATAGPGTIPSLPSARSVVHRGETPGKCQSWRSGPPRVVQSVPVCAALSLVAAVTLPSQNARAHHLHAATAPTITAAAASSSGDSRDIHHAQRWRCWGCRDSLRARARYHSQQPRAVASRAARAFTSTAFSAQRCWGYAPGRGGGGGGSVCCRRGSVRHAHDQPARHGGGCLPARA